MKCVAAEVVVASAAEDAQFNLLDQIVSSEGPFSASLSEEMRTAVRAWVAAAGKSRLDECFGWAVRPGEHSIARRFAAASRVAAFADALRTIVDTENISDWRRCEVLSTELAEFERVYWPKWKDTGIPVGASLLRSAIFRIFNALDQAPPMSAKGVYELLKRAGLLK